MTFFCFCHAQKNAFAFFVALPFRQITIRLCGLDFRLPIALCDVNRLVVIFLLGGHAALKRKKCRLPHENSWVDRYRQRRAAYSKGTVPAWSVRHPVVHFCYTRHIVLSAKGAVFTSKPGAAPQDYRNTKHQR